MVSQHIRRIRQSIATGFASPARTFHLQGRSGASLEAGPAAGLSRGQSMDFDAAMDFATEWTEAWNAHDLDRIISHYAETLHYCSPLVLERIPGSDGAIRDRATLRTYVQTGLGKNPALRFTFREVLMGVQGFTLHYDNARKGRTAECFEFDADGKVCKAVSCYSA